jgi:hypothetical protein
MHGLIDLITDCVFKLELVLWNQIVWESTLIASKLMLDTLCELRVRLSNLYPREFFTELEHAFHVLVILKFFTHFLCEKGKLLVKVLISGGMACFNCSA